MKRKSVVIIGLVSIWLALLQSIPVSYAQQDDASFQEFQSIPSPLAFDWEFFSIDGEHYLALANWVDGGNFEIDSKIYRWNGSIFVEYQSIATYGANDWEFFSIQGNHYLAVANNPYGDAVPESKIYRWDGASFVEFQSLPTTNPADWEFFELDGDYYLAAANHHDGGNYSVDSTIYQWQGDAFVEFQSLASEYANDWAFFSIDNQHYLALAGRSESPIYRWDGEQFAEFQVINNGDADAADWEYFNIDGEHYVALANWGIQASPSVIYHWDGASFVEFQTMTTVEASDWEFFSLGSEHYIALAQSYGDFQDSDVYSVVYRWDGANFVEFQAIPTDKTQSWAAFSIEGEHFLAAANGLAVDESKLYKMDTPLLAMYVLAFDNHALSTSNLSTYYPDSMQGIVEATISRPGITAIVLTDQSGPDNTLIYHVRNGLVTRIQGLPAAGGALDPQLREYDTTDPNALGAFIRWARQTYAADGGKTLFAYVGHNAPLAPETDVNNIFDNAIDFDVNSLFPLPMHIGAHPDFTDNTPVNLLSTHDLAQALRIGTDDGAQPIDLVDMVYCFAASLEGMYPLRNYAHTLVGSPNFAYFGPNFIGKGLIAAQQSDSAIDMANAIVNAYKSELPATQHPYILVAVDSSQLDAVKNAWDEVSWHLWQGLDKPEMRQVYKTWLGQAYANSHKYDTTFCQQDWALDSPDALVDVGDFAWHLRLQFGGLSSVGLAAAQTFEALGQAVITRTHTNGTPWFVAPLAPVWNFDGNSGISLYADLAGAPDNGSTVLSWHAQWYTRTVSANNPQPYSFIVSGTNGVTWADVFYKFWQGTPNIKTAACLPTLPPVVQEGKLSIAEIIYPVTGTVSSGEAVTLSVAISTTTTALNPLVAFTVTQNGVLVFSDTVGTGHLVAGMHQIDSAKTWTPSETGPFTIKVEADADDRVAEVDETDNTHTRTDEVLSPKPQRPLVTATISNQQQWLTNSTIPLHVVQTWPAQPTSNTRVRMLFIDTYQYRPGTNPKTQDPLKVERRVLDPLAMPLTSFNLSPQVRPGPVVLHIWGESKKGGLSARPIIVTFNYAPADTAIQPGRMHYFLLRTGAGDHIDLTLAITQGDADIYVWEPHNFWAALAIVGPGGGFIPVNSAVAGDYVIGVRGVELNNTYTLTVDIRQPQGSSSVQVKIASDNVLNLSEPRPSFVAPVTTPVIATPRYRIYLPVVLCQP